MIKAEIGIDGVMTIRVETELEGYALKQWCIDNVDPVSNTGNLLFNADPNADLEVTITRKE